ncbi:myelin transcription factor 1 [Astyanax mexicanus]|nr:myelin transcription factor 1 [Astyanax mexicanus]XP_049329526.1 myelin transcription factor 1 [Astyanax mexicanus]
MAAFVEGCYRPYLLCPVCKKTRWNLGAHLRRRCMRGRSAAEVEREVEMEKMTAQDLLRDGRVWDYSLIRRIMDQPDPIRCFMAQLKDRGNVVVNIPPEAIPPLIPYLPEAPPPAVGVAESESDSDSESSGPDVRKRESVNQQQETASGSDSEEPSSVRSRKKRKRQEEEEEEEEETTTDDEEEEDEDEHTTWTFSSRMMDDEEEDEEDDEEDDEESSWMPRTSSSRTPGDEEEDDKKSRNTSRTFTSRMTDDEKHLTEGRLTSCSENAEMHYCMQEFGNVVAASVLLKRLTTHSYEQEDNTTDSAPENREQQAAYEKLLEACPITVGGALPKGRMLTELTGAHERYCSERWLIDQRQLQSKKILLEYLK